MGKSQHLNLSGRFVRKAGSAALAASLVLAFSPVCEASAFAVSSAGSDPAAQGGISSGVSLLSYNGSASKYGNAVIGQESYMVWNESAGAYQATFTAPQHLTYAIWNTQSVQDGTFAIKDASGATLVSQGACDFDEIPFTLDEGERVFIEVSGGTHFDEDTTLSLYTKVVGIPQDSADYGNFKGDWNTSSKARISSISPKVTDAAYDMLANYIGKDHLDLATTVRSTPADAKVLKKLSDQIVAQGGTDTQKAIRMALWSAHNVKYDNGVAHGAIDTFYERKADCKGFAALTAELMRLAGIPAVFAAGYNAANVGGLSKLTFAKAVESGDANHAWVYAYTDGQWRMYDPLFGVYASTDKTEQSKNYYPWHIAAITPTYQGEDLSVAGDAGYGFFLIGQRVIFCSNGKPDSMNESGSTPTIMMDFDGLCMTGVPLQMNSGSSYWEGDSQWAGKEYERQYLDELLKGGAVYDGDSAYVRDSAGVAYAGSFPVDAVSGNKLFIAYNSRVLRFIGDADTVQLSKGRPVIEVDKPARLLLPTEYGSSDYRVEFSVEESGDNAAFTTVEADGTVKCTHAGNVWVNYDVYATDDGRLLGSGDIQYTACKPSKRNANYTDDPSKWVRDPVVPGITDGTGKRLKAGSSIAGGNLAYTVLAGQKTVSVKVKDAATAKSLKSASVPATVKDGNGNIYKVTSVAKSGFKGCSKLKSVRVASDSLATIGSGAFAGTKSLTSVVISSTDKLKTVKGAFKGAGKGSGKGLVVKVKSSKLLAYKKLILAKGGNKKLTVRKA